jgi:hypothetical protein
MTGTTPPTSPTPSLPATAKFWLFILGQLANGVIAVELAPPGSVWVKLCNLAIFVLGGAGLLSAQHAVKAARSGTGT